MLWDGFRELEYWRPVHENGVNILPCADKIVLAWPDGRVEHTVSNAQFSELVHLPRVSAPSVQRITGKTTTEYDLTAIVEALQDVRLGGKAISFDANAPRAYKVEYSNIHDDVKVKGRRLFTPIIDGAFCPASCRSNDLACIDGRLTQLQRELRPVPPKYYKYITEFISCMGGVAPHTLHPDDISDVMAASSGSQRKKYENALMEPLALRHKAFQKVESYDEPKWPRNISAVDPKHVVKLSRFIQPLVRMKKEYCHWYAFGKSPRAMADAVCEMCLDDFGVLVEGDFSKYDGRQSTFVVDFNTAVMLHFFHPDYHDEIRELRYELSYSMFTTEYGVLYCTADTCKSGSASTSSDNTDFHGYCQFSHFRNMGFVKEEAYKRIGLCGGDDGLMRTTNPQNYEDTCRDLNMLLKCTVRSPGDPVGFLGRVWVDWKSPRSFFDPFRCLSKLHFSDSSDKLVSVNDLAFRKALGYYVTDKGNFIGHIAHHLLTITKTGKTEVKERREWLTGILEENTRYTLAEVENIVQESVFPTFCSNPHTLRLDTGEVDPCYDHFMNQVGKHGIKREQLETWYRVFMTSLDVRQIPQLYSIPVPENLPVAISVDGMDYGPNMTPAPVPPVPTMPVCYSLFVNKECKRKRCKFSHDLNVCFDFCKGKCRRVTCKRPHVPLSAKV
jgi:hypothetical protein